MNDNNSAEDYFKEVLTFLKEFKWLYDVPLTRILVDESLDKIPPDWLNVLERLDNEQLNNFVTKLDAQLDWPTSLIEFFSVCKKLNKLPDPTIPPLSTKLPVTFIKNLTVKKQHEILHFSRLIHEHCQLHNISLIVDLGAGVGHLCQLLNYLYGYKIVGVDSSEHNIEKARLRQRTIFPDSLSTVKYMCLSITEDSAKFIESTLEQEFEGKENFCLLGLHACGDLSIYASKMYLEMEMAQLLIMVSCCYHKLSLEETSTSTNQNEYFKYFPLSNVLKNTFEVLDIDVGSLIRRPFMRLACQETSDRWLTLDEESHDKHSLHVLSRAVLELYVSQNGLQLKKLVRKGTRKSQCLNFENYLEDSMLRYKCEKISSNQESTVEVPWTLEIKGEIESLWKNNVDKLKSIEPYTALQMLLQNVAESLVLIDRLHYLKENDCHANLFPIANRSLSPRCFALISNKIT